MRSINYCPPPIERFPDLTECGVLEDYELHSIEYPGAWEMSQFLRNLRYCDYSRPMDDFYLDDGVIKSNWVIFFTCRPTDAERLVHIANYLKYPVYILNSEGLML